MGYTNENWADRCFSTWQKINSSFDFLLKKAAFFSVEGKNWTVYWSHCYKYDFWVAKVSFSSLCCPPWISRFQLGWLLKMTSFLPSWYLLICLIVRPKTYPLPCLSPLPCLCWSVAVLRNLVNTLSEMYALNLGEALSKELSNLYFSFY